MEKISSQENLAVYVAPRMSGTYELRWSFMAGSNCEMKIPDITEENLDW